MFGDDFSHKLGKGMLPDGLVELELGVDYNHSLNEGVLPSSLLKLRMNGHFVQHIDILPGSLQELHLYGYVSCSGHLPSHLRELVFGAKFSVCTREC